MLPIAGLCKIGVIRALIAVDGAMTGGLAERVTGSGVAVMGGTFFQVNGGNGPM
jgi:hypothetical protein